MTVFFCDYASAGNEWRRDNFYRIWFPVERGGGMRIAELLLVCGMLVAGKGSFAAACPYSVSCNGSAVELQDARVSAYPFCRVWPGYQRATDQTELAHFVRFDLSAPTEMTVCGKEIAAAFRRMLPLKDASVVRTNDTDSLTLALSRPGAYVLAFDGLPTLHVFADPPLPPIPEPDPGGRTIRFPRGEHHPGVIAPKSGDVVVLDEGAVVYGALCILDATNVTVTGRGIFDGSRLERADSALRAFHRAHGLPEIDTESACFAWSVCGSENVTICGVTFRDAPFWTLVIRNGCRRTLVDNIHVIGNWRYNSDGVDICASADTVVRNSFFRTFDDCVIARGPYLPGEHDPVDGLVVTNCDLHCDWGCAVKAQVQDFSGSAIENVRVADCRILKTTGLAFFLAVRYGADLDIIRNFAAEDIDIDFVPQPNPMLQKSNGQAFVAVPRTGCTLVHATSYTLGKNLGDQRNAPAEDPSHYHFLFENLAFRRFRTHGEKLHLHAGFDAVVPNHVIRDVTLEDMPIKELTQKGNVRFRKPRRSGPNYDESKIAPYRLEDPLTFANGERVATPGQWPQRRAEIVRIFEREMFGRTPPPPEAVVSELTEERPILAGQAIRRQYRVWFRQDRSGPFLDWLVVLPNRIVNEKPSVREGRVVCENGGRVPVILMLNYRGNGELLSNKDFPVPIEMIAARGYALMSARYGQVSPDPDICAGAHEDEAYAGVFALWPKRDPLAEDNVTAIGAWAWAFSRGLDLAERIPEIDAKRCVVTGCSRLGKAALLAASRDERFAVCVPCQTGGGGCPLAKRDFGENVETMTEMFPHWYCRAYGKYVNDERAMPFDQHLLLASIAPRALLVEGFNAGWFDTKGEYLAVRAASPVWAFLGAGPCPDEPFPANYSTASIGQNLGYVRRGGEHGIAGCDWRWLLDFADAAFAPNDFPKAFFPSNQQTRTERTR